VQTLIVQAISVEELSELNTFAVGMYDSIETPEQWFQLQKALVIDEQDQALGMDTYCVVLSNGVTHYGGIESCVLQQDLLRLHLTVVAAQALGIEEEVEASVAVIDNHTALPYNAI